MLGCCPDSSKAYINARSNTLCPFCTNVSDMPFPPFAVWTVAEKDVHENQQWKPNRFSALTICAHHLCLSKGELGFPRNPTERQIVLHQSQTFSWKNTVLVMTGGRERTEMSEIWMMGGGGMCVLCGRHLVWLSGYYLFLWGVCISTIRLLSMPHATYPPPHLPFPGMSPPQWTLGTLGSRERWHKADLLLLAELYKALRDLLFFFLLLQTRGVELWNGEIMKNVSRVQMKGSNRRSTQISFTSPESAVSWA